MDQLLPAVLPLAADADHRGAVPLALVGIALFLAAIVVRRIIKLATVVVVVGIVAVVLAAWRGGILG
ncbi:MAG: hypothetical protein ACJ74O_15135 [Frankiaceae bacterium]